MSAVEDICATPPHAPPEREPSLCGRKFVWVLSPPWDNVWTRQNHFALRLAKLGAEILYVENPSAWSSTLKQKGWRHLPLLPGATRTREVVPGVHVMSPAFSFPGTKRSNVVARLNGQITAAAIKTWLRSRHWQDYACWCRVPHSVFTLENLQPAGAVYDITDDYELYEQNVRCKELVSAREQALLQRADLVLVTAEELLKKETLRGRNCRLIPNGVEYDLFAQASARGTIDPLLAKMPRPVIGYVGLTSHWMDFELLEILGRRWPGQVLMLGPVAAHVEAQAKAIPGLVWGGFVPQTELPPYLRGVDVFIMPHLVNELRKKANPLKIWEYLATGKPFVSVDLPALNPVRHLVDIARDRAHFAQLVEQRLASQNEARARACQDYARTQSWDAIFKRLLPQLLAQPFAS